MGPFCVGPGYLSPGCGLGFGVVTLPGMWVGVLFYCFAVLVVVGCIGLLPFPQFFGEVLSVFLFFWALARVFFGCVALPFGNKCLLIQKKKKNS